MSIPCESRYQCFPAAVISLAAESSGSYWITPCQCMLSYTVRCWFSFLVARQLVLSLCSYHVPIVSAGSTLRRLYFTVSGSETGLLLRCREFGTFSTTVIKLLLDINLRIEANLHCFLDLECKFSTCHEGPELKMNFLCTDVTNCLFHE